MNLRLSIDALRVFRAVAQTGSMSQAASLLHLNDNLASRAGPRSEGSPFRDLLRPNYRPQARVVIVVSLLIAILLMVIAGLSIGHSLTRLAAA